MGDVLFSILIQESFMGISESRNATKTTNGMTSGKGFWKCSLTFISQAFKGFLLTDICICGECLILLKLRKNSSSVEIREMFLRKSSVKNICYQIAMVWFFMRILCVPFRHPQPPCPTPKGAIIVLTRGGVTSIPICPDVWTF